MKNLPIIVFTSLLGLLGASQAALNSDIKTLASNHNLDNIERVKGYGALRDQLNEVYVKILMRMDQREDELADDLRDIIKIHQQYNH